MSTLNCPFNLSGKTALITGAAGLLGVEHAMALISIGAKLILTDLSKVALQQVKSRIEDAYPSSQIMIQTMDVTDAKAIKKIEETLPHDWKVDVLINNAAIDAKVTAEGSSVEMSRLENFFLSQWQKEIDVGLTGAFLCSQIFGVTMVKRGGGVILNIASDLSIIAPDQRLYRSEGLPMEQQPVKPITYSVIKSALIGLTRYLASYWADQGIRANALSPGGVYTDQKEGFVSKLAERIPIGRMAAKNEYWGAVQFLCSDASRYMTGQNIVIDGGRSVW